jgi:hypothetical protein|tara:strand:+ start:3237 stop:3740 length:504 start_codon:yes stop_codon:yes gene_type:complete
MAESTSVAVRRDGKIFIKDGTSPTPNAYEVAYENGDFTYTEEKADRVVIRDRGTIVGLRSADDPVLSFSFTVHMRELTNASSDSIIDFIMKTGNASSYTSTGGNGFEQYLVDIDFDVDKTSVGAEVVGHRATLSKCLLTYQISEGDPDSISLTGECYGGIVRSTFTP